MTDVRVVQCGDRARLAREAFRELGRRDLDGDVAIESRVARAIDLAHAAFTDGGKDLVRTEAGTGAQRQAG
jgi:hypothetical protein